MTTPHIQSLGILGAGRIGKAIAALARNAGLDVDLAGSTGPFEDVYRADAVVLAIPLSQLRTVPAEHLAGVLVIDAMNYWWELDGRLPDFEDPLTSSSEQVQAFLSDARVTKTFNHLSGYALEELARPAGDADRLSLAIAGDSDDDIAAVGELVDRLGFDPLPAGPLAEGVRFEPTTELFGADADLDEARDMLERFWDSQRGRVVARARAATNLGDERRDF